MNAGQSDSVELEGSHFDIGRAYGEMIRPEFGKVVEQYAGNYLRKHDQEQVLGVKEGMEAYLEVHAPSILEEMRGIAEGSGVATDDVVKHNLCSHINAVLTPAESTAGEACTSVYFAAGDRGPLLAKNTDVGEPTPENIVRFKPMLLWRPRDGFAHVGNTHMGTVWRHVGINEKGLALGGSSVSGGVGGFQPGLTDGFLGRLFLERCATVEEAVSLVQSHVFVGQGVNLIVGDENGDAAVFELSVDGTVVDRLDGRDHLFTTNFYASGKLAHGPSSKEWLIANSRARHAFLSGLQPGGSEGFALDQAEGILRHHAVEGAICQHSDRNRMSTTFSTVAVCRERLLLTAWGKPCQDPFHVYGLNQ